MSLFSSYHPICPECGYVLLNDDMLESDVDLYALAPNEGTEQIACPSCDEKFYVRGSYTPHYTTAVDEDDL